MAAASTTNPDPLASEGTFHKIKDLGSGSFGHVALYSRLGHDEPVAVKCLPVRVVDYNMVKREVRSHCSLNHRKAKGLKGFGWVWVFPRSTPLQSWG